MTPITKALPLLGTLLFLTTLGAEEALTKTLDRFCSMLESLEVSLTKEDRKWEDVSEAEERTLWESL